MCTARSGQDKCCEQPEVMELRFVDESGTNHICFQSDRCAAHAPLDLIPASEAREVLRGIGMESGMAAAILSAREGIRDDAYLRQVYSCALGDLLTNMGKPVPVDGWTGFPAIVRSGQPGKFVYVWAMLAAFDPVMAFHRELGVPAEISLASLRRLAYSFPRRSRMTGQFGAPRERSLALAFRGVSFSLGRLTFDRSTFWFSDSDTAGRTCNRGASALSVHIPAGGRLNPADCDASFTMAERFAADFFEEPLQGFECTSWLLDEHLADYLGESSNIAHFGRRFRIVPETNPEVRSPNADSAVMANVFGVVADPFLAGPGVASMSDGTTSTSLSRAVLTHFASGRSFHKRIGWFPTSSSLSTVRKERL